MTAPPADLADLADALGRAVEARSAIVDAGHETAFRLFNGFSEGWPALACDVYGRTLVLHDHADGPRGDETAVRTALDLLRPRLPWIRAALWKARHGATAEARHGRLLLGAASDLQPNIVEDGVRYALALALHRDASFYLDTRELRAWSRRHLRGKRVLNTFAYTGSLGVAAQAAPAAAVVHIDHRRAFLDVARASYRLNKFPVRGTDFRSGDFFLETSRLRRQGGLFDCVLLDPPLFSASPGGRVDLEASAGRLIGKVQPLVGDSGYLVVVNNALWVSGAEYVRVLEASLAHGYVEIETFLPVPRDVAGYRTPDRACWPADPAPFNHPTKIAVLRVRRKDGRRA